MEKVKIYYKPEVVKYINDLVFKLNENAIEYKNNLLDFIEKDISIFPKKLTPLSIAYLGSNYIFLKKKKNTYLVTYITNNHNSISNRL
ncbi:hypothetical protein [Polaribacter cellanae]|uniref:Uncharacterized protein n=1 Tax=Polaribacter cellanae TaxID=2818493 RepID=A0A975CKW8_9FLAO|nr:hypothetical protein [Polaribacter cellanae]QTE21548.1 hypothetical protein J3359_12030 [Polaribacter cellanae]